jgi:cytochrome c oxidase assembly factor CtaG
MRKPGKQQLVRWGLALYVACGSTDVAFAHTNEGIIKGRTIPWHLTSLEDQQLGGLIMWVPSCLILIVVGLALFTAWMGEAERRQRLSSFSQSFLEEEKLVSSESSLEPGMEDAGESRQTA